jgi:hypothetical protein
MLGSSGRAAFRPLSWILSSLLALAVGAGCGSDSPPAGNVADIVVADNAAIVVTTLEDAAVRPRGKMTLRAAIQMLEPGGTITFDNSLDGGTIRLAFVDNDHSVLKGEVFGGASGMVFQNFLERDYGRSALYARKRIRIDASALPRGITLKWDGGESNRARVLAVYDDAMSDTTTEPALTLNNVTITGGYSSYEARNDNVQRFTLARGGAVAVWGIAKLDNCTLYGNRVLGDPESGRDRGTFGGGIYADVVLMDNCIVSGNSVKGYGVAGGGVYSVGAWEKTGGDGLSALTRCTVTGNRLTGQMTYGGGVYSDGGSLRNVGGIAIPNTNMIQLVNCTIARNVCEDNPDLAEGAGIPTSTGPMLSYFYRGGGFYMSNGYLRMISCTVAENQVNGIEAISQGKPNLGGGGIGATVGNAHSTEEMQIMHSVIVGNTLNGVPNDVFTGSILRFHSYGYNVIGRIDLSQILVPIPMFSTTSRKHWPKVGDRHGLLTSEVLGSPVRHASIRSMGTDWGENAVLYYPPAGQGLGRIPTDPYSLYSAYIDYEVGAFALDGTFTSSSAASLDRTTGSPDNAYIADDFPSHVLAKLRAEYSATLGAGFTVPIADNTYWHVRKGNSWPGDPLNATWVNFWRTLDNTIGDRLGPAILGEDFFASFIPGAVPSGDTISYEGRVGDRILYHVQWDREGLGGSIVDHPPYELAVEDQLGRTRPRGVYGDIGAIRH